MKSNHSLSFVSIFSFYNVLHSDCLRRGFAGFNPDVYMLFSLLVTVGSYGMTCFGCCRMLYSNRNGSNVRRLQYRLKFLIDSGYLVKFYYKGRCRYKISSHAEKLILKSLGKDNIRDMADYIKSCLKD